MRFWFFFQIGFIHSPLYISKGVLRKTKLVVAINFACFHWCEAVKLGEMFQDAWENALKYLGGWINFNYDKIEQNTDGKLTFG